jgi:hypothetical protein
MGKVKAILCAVLLLALLFGFLIPFDSPGIAQGGVRFTTVTVPYTQYEWWLIRWETNEIKCQFYTDHEGLPTPAEVSINCGQTLATQWMRTPACSPKKNKTGCTGLYLHLVSITPAQKEIQVELPGPTATVSLEGCNPTPPENYCATIPALLVTGIEPLPEEEITSIEGLYVGIPFQCPGSQCLIPLQPTSTQGAVIEFWANSSYGDSSDRYTVMVRVLDTGVTSTPGTSGWYVDVISNQSEGIPISGCMKLWQAFPPAGAVPSWLSSPDQSSLIASDNPYFYLAGRLIAQAQVDASSCPTGGLLPNGYADSCGIEKARPVLAEWQNQFDARILEVSQQTGVPGQLMKNLFAQESQFWPGVFRVNYELGLGQITDKGTDSIFLWNTEFYNQFCPLVLSEETCELGYLHLEEGQKELLRGALAAQAGVECQTCPGGVDLDKASFSIGLFAQMLIANCTQVDQTIYTATRLPSGQVASYEDLWRFTVANYHAGPGCVAYAIHSAWQGISPLTWDQVAASFTPACQGVVPYVNEISR